MYLPSDIIARDLSAYWMHWMWRQLLHTRVHYSSWWQLYPKLFAVLLPKANYPEWNMDFRFYSCTFFILNFLSNVIFASSCQKRIKIMVMFEIKVPGSHTIVVLFFKKTACVCVGKKTWFPDISFFFFFFFFENGKQAKIKIYVKNINTPPQVFLNLFSNFLVVRACGVAYDFTA